jgi:predicted Zn-dependent peptidase
MLEFTKFTLDNGLRLLVNEDRSTPLVAINILFCVGSRNETPERTGFAHLFEHLMFGGSIHIPSFDEPLQMVGGENNAFTNNDITNYYITLPADNIETGLWLESDRMLELQFSEQSLNVQQNVVTEEYRQRYLNQPYGDVWLLLSPMAFKVHPYQWPTIGKNIEHIQNATLNDVKSFFYSHYAPNNAIITLSGNIEPAKAFELVNKWFGPIGKRDVINNHIPVEPKQTEKRECTVHRKVPFDSIYKAWHIAARNEKEFLVCDLITDILAGGRSGRLYQRLVKEKHLFSDINAFVTGSIDPGLLVISGKLMEGVSMQTAENEIAILLDELKNTPLDEMELQKVKNKFEANFLLGQTNILNKAMGLSYFEMMGDASDINLEIEKYQAITQNDILETTSKVIDENNCSTLYYLADKNN